MQAYVELGSRATIDHVYELRLLLEPRALERSLRASDDAQVWRIVQGRAPIFRFRKDSREGTQTDSPS